jgi:hypothetical protein
MSVAVMQLSAAQAGTRSLQYADVVGRNADPTGPPMYPAGYYCNTNGLLIYGSLYRSGWRHISKRKELSLATQGTHNLTDKPHCEIVCLDPNHKT